MRKVNGQTYSEWRDAFLASQNMTLPLDLDTKRDTLYSACPNGFFPSTDAQRWQIFVTMDRTADQREELVYVPDATTGATTVEAYIQLEFDAFFDVCVRRATLAAVDIENIREMAMNWAAAHPRALRNVDVFMKKVKKAAGL